MNQQTSGHINMGYMAFLSGIAALGGFLFGYDTAVISGTIFQVAQQFQLDAISQGWYVGCALVGSIAGVSFAGFLSDRFGRKSTMILSAFLFSLSAFGCAFATNFDWLVFYRIVGGIGIGVVSIVSPLYISEVSAAKYRGRLVSLYQLAITIGFLAAYCANFLLSNWSTQGGQLPLEWMRQVFVSEVWRGMLGVEGIPALLFLLVLLRVPESPRWLILRHDERGASLILSRIYTSASKVQNEIHEVKAMINTDRGSDWRQLLEPSVLRAVIIGAAIAILGQFMGVNAVLYYGPSIFENAGLSSGDSLFYQVLVGLVNMLTTVLALLIIDRIGRKSLVYYGVSGMIVCLLAIGAYFAKAESWGLSVYFLLTFFLLYVFCCAVSISAVIFVFLSEMYPARVRGMAMSVAGLSLWVGTYLIGQLTPWMLEALTPAGTFFLFAFMCVPYLLIVWRLMPETAGRSLEDIERYWRKYGK